MFASAIRVDVRCTPLICSVPITCMLFVLSLAFVAAYLVGKRFGRRQAVTFGIAACVKNAALVPVVGVTGFGPAVLPPLVANLIAQNLLVVLLRIFIRDGAKLAPA